MDKEIRELWARRHVDLQNRLETIIIMLVGIFVALCGILYKI